MKYGVKTPSRHNIASIASFKRSLSFRFVYNFNFFYLLKHLNFKLTEEKYQELSRFSRVSLWRAVTTQLWPRHNKNNFFGTQHYTKIRGATMPQITIRAKEKWQPYLTTHTPLNTKHTRAHAHSTLKQRKEIKLRVSK